MKMSDIHLSANTIKLQFFRQSGTFDFGLCHLTFDKRQIEKCKIEFLNTEEILFYDALKYPRKKESYLFGRVCAKMAILQLCPELISTSILITSGVFSFPVVQNVDAQRLDVSISHCHDEVVSVAFFAEHPLGIDLELLDIDKLDLLKSKVSLNEISAFNGLPLSCLETCTIAWTIKEALSKILRTGLTFDFNKIEICSIRKEGQAILAEFVDFQQYRSISFVCNKKVFSMVYPKQSAIDHANLEDFIMQSFMS